MYAAASIVLDSRELQFLGCAFDEALAILEVTVAGAVAESTKLRLATLLMSLNQSGDLDKDELIDTALRAMKGHRSLNLRPAVSRTVKGPTAQLSVEHGDPVPA